MTDPTDATAESGLKTEQGPIVPRGILKFVTRLNVIVYRLSGGRLMNRMGGGPICLVTTTGAKTGRRRTIPLMYVPYKDGVLLVASQGGAPTNPVWYGNLKADPRVTVEQGGRTMTLVAREITGDERVEAWPICVQHYPPYADYVKRTNRVIPVIYCGPEQHA